jgi:quercetin dioxygenase-like cupin family protein
MKSIVRVLITAGIALSGSSLIAAEPSPDPHGTIIPRFEHAIPNIPGKSLVAVEVQYAPGDDTGPHRHAGSSFIMAYVISGSIVSQVEGELERTFHAGETWYENPGAHHIVSRNASKTKPARLLAVFVVDSGDKNLVTPDHK